ncbi:MAG: hypothetical protein R3C52_01270 [Hyphomonadaceae bacterium]
MRFRIMSHDVKTPNRARGRAGDPDEDHREANGHDHPSQCEHDHERERLHGRSHERLARNEDQPSEPQAPGGADGGGRGQR